MFIRSRSFVFLLLIYTSFLVVVSCKGKKPIENPVPELPVVPEITEEVKGNTSNDKIAPSELDEILLSELIRSRVNDIRSRYDLQPLKRHQALKKAALDHNDYITSIGKLTHNGNTEKSYDVRSRVDNYESSFRILAENVLMRQYFINSTEGTEVIRDNNYESVADQLFEMWKNSEGHYKNMMRSDIEYVGTAVRWNDAQNAIYATQVFGG